MDIKLQVYKGEAGPEKVDFRKSTGGFLGYPEDCHRTMMETRITDVDLDEMGLGEAEFFALLPTVNRILAKFADRVPANAVKALGMSMEGSGDLKLAIRAYDND